MAAKKRNPKRPVRRNEATASKSPERKALQDRFLQALRDQGTVGVACQHCGIGARSTVYRWRDADPEFAERMDEIVEVATDDLVTSNFARARDGWLEPVWYKGEECGQVRKYDHTLAIFFMKHRRPEEFMERVVAERLLRESGGDVRSVAARLREIAKEMDGSVPSEPEGDQDG